jgi:hypothetical protein
VVNLNFQKSNLVAALAASEIQIYNDHNFVAVWAPVGYKSTLSVCGGTGRQ